MVTFQEIDDTLEELFLLLLAMGTFGLSFILIPKGRECTNSYIHNIYKYVDFYYVSKDSTRSKSSKKHVRIDKYS